MLESFGVDPRSEAVYLEILGDPAAELSSVSERLGLTETEVEASVERLTQLSLLRRSANGLRRLRAVPPDVGLSEYINRCWAEVLRQQQELTERYGALRELIDQRVSFEPAKSAREARVDEVADPRALEDRVERLIDSTRRELLLFTPDPPVAVDGGAVATPIEERMAERGVRVRLVYPGRIRSDKGYSTYFRRLEALGIEVRTTPTPPPRTLIFDRSALVMSAWPDGPDSGAEEDANRAVVVHDIGLVSVVSALFDHVWSTAEVLTLGSSAPAGEYSSRERVLINLLLCGQTDEQVARRLGISPRTVARMVADVRARVGARSRFELGAIIERSLSY